MWPFGQNNPKHDDLTSDTHTYELLVSAEIISKTKTNENNK